MTVKPTTGPSPDDFRRLPTWGLARAAARSHRVLSGALAGLGATGYQFRVLSVLRRAPATQAEIGRNAHLDPRDVTVTVAHLVGAGLVARDRSEEDARALVVTVTDAGLEWLRHLDRAAEAAQDEVFGTLSAEERTVLLGLLGRIADPDETRP